MSLILKLATRNLFQDRLRFVATIIGIVFSIVLITLQLGLFMSFERMVTTMIDHAPTDLWVMPLGTKCFEDPSLLNTSLRTDILAVKGVSEALPVLVGFAEWTVPHGGGTTPVFVIGSDKGGGVEPWQLIEGSTEALSQTDAVAVDKTYFGRLGISQIGDETEMRDHKARVEAVTNGIRSFTTTPYVFTSLERARTYVGIPTNKVTYYLVHLAPGADVADVRSRLTANLSKAEVLTPEEFRTRSRSFWLFGTGAGAALFAGALLGAIVGTVIVALTLYSSTKDHLTEFATLRAIGSSGVYIHKVIICQALLSAVIGFSLAAGLGLLIVALTANSSLPILMTPGLTAGLLVLTIVMCVVSAIAAIIKVMRIDPVMVFNP